MKKALLLLLLLSAVLLAPASLAEPLALTEDLAGAEVLPIGENRTYTYTYAYPQVDDSDPSAALINEFYRYRVSDALDFEVPMMADYYASDGGRDSIFVRIGYTVTCNNDAYFSVLLKSEGNDYQTYTGHTFSRTDLKPGSSVALPYLLGILETDESDSWLQDRQTARADTLVRGLVWKMLEEHREELGIDPEFTEEIFALSFYPEEDFYLDENGDPVFYLEPGLAAEPGKGLLTFPIPLSLILDEL